ncbi:flagellar hook-length control protein FliK [Leptospira ilyithenensis]|uniref:Flagellar hook-length control protein FliK n=1 Tax=Leptospira ilyithenensis TaxID=2484901 RepID=A0A4R9LQI6_9LEPT|nr:flagellar hook-length control protein FliK [Leptospira ilyithenensis]TGN11812.1 flagellar hook-length control protein FliK [Leptospira ilyithenensis]
MNISQEPKRQLSLVAPDFKLPVLDVPVATNTNKANEKFSDFLFPDPANSPAPLANDSANKSSILAYDDTKIPSEPGSSDKKEKIEETSKTEIPKSEKEIKDSSEEEETDEDEDLALSAELLSNLIFFPSASERSVKNKEDGLKDSAQSPQKLALLKSNDKNPPYAGNAKEAGSFLEDAKKLAETFFRKETKETKSKDKLEPNLKKESGLEDLNGKSEGWDLKTVSKNEKLIIGSFRKEEAKPKEIKKESVTKTSTVSSAPANGEKVFKSEIESVKQDNFKQNIFLSDRNPEKTKENSASKKLSAKEDPSKDKSNLVSESTAVPEKMIRSLGVKDREFNKSDNRNQSVVDKVKPKETLEIQIPSAQFNSKEEGSAGGEKKGSLRQEGFSFQNELRSSAKTDESARAEKLTTPNKQNIQKNLDELVKQARFDIVQNGKSTAEIIMNPKEFGRLTLKVTVDGEKVEGRILVESEEMKSLITNEIAKLTESLRESGLELENLLVDIWDNSGSSLSGNSQDRWKQFDPESVQSYSSNAKKQALDDEAEISSRLKPAQDGLEIFV